MLMYKDGEPLRDLRNYYSKEGPPQSVEVRIPAHCLTSNNRHVRARQLWGSDVYTEDSDLVAVLMHCGYWYHSLTHPPAQVAEVRAVLTPLAPQPRYPSTARNSIRSRAWAAPIEGCSYRVDKCWVVTRSGTSVDLAPNLEGVPAAAPTFTPSHGERMVTRSSGAGAGRQRQVQVRGGGGWGGEGGGGREPDKQIVVLLIFERVQPGGAARRCWVCRHGCRLLRLPSGALLRSPRLACSMWCAPACAGPARPASSGGPALPRCSPQPSHASALASCAARCAPRRRSPPPGAAAAGGDCDVQPGE
jgi:hypothetical protein